MKITHIACLGAVICAAPSTFAGVVSIGEFTGDFSEGFENIAAPGAVPGPVDIFGGAGTISDTFANNLVIAQNVASQDTDWVPFFPYDGFLMGLVPTGFATFTFETPVTQFGGFFGSAAFQSGGAVTFLDENGGAIDSVSFDVPALEWNWHGWQSEVPIASIQLRASANPGAPLVIDNLQITQIPAPGALALLVFGACMPRRRRH